MSDLQLSINTNQPKAPTFHLYYVEKHHKIVAWLKSPTRLSMTHTFFTLMDDVGNGHWIHYGEIHDSHPADILNLDRTEHWTTPCRPKNFENSIFLSENTTWSHLRMHHPLLSLGALHTIGLDPKTTQTRSKHVFESWQHSPLKFYFHAVEMEKTWPFNAPGAGSMVRKSTEVYLRNGRKVISIMDTDALDGKTPVTSSHVYLADENDSQPSWRESYLIKAPWSELDALVRTIPLSANDFIKHGLVDDDPSVYVKESLAEIPKNAFVHLSPKTAWNLHDLSKIKMVYPFLNIVVRFVRFVLKHPTLKEVVLTKVLILGGAQVKDKEKLFKRAILDTFYYVSPLPTFSIPTFPL